jgi:hypothetical protein
VHSPAGLLRCDVLLNAAEGAPPLGRKLDVTTCTLYVPGLGVAAAAVLARSPKRSVPLLNALFNAALCPKLEPGVYAPGCSGYKLHLKAQSLQTGFSLQKKENKGARARLW